MSDTRIEKQLIAAAIRRKELLSRRQSYDAYRPDSRPTVVQQQILDDINTQSCRYVIAGNQCKPGESLVLSPRGPVRLDSLKVGDIVYDENGQEQFVTKVWDNGPKEIGDLRTRSKVMGACTAEHKWWTYSYVPKSNEVIGIGKIIAAELGADTKVAITRVKAPLGSVDNPHAYVIGALLGDGCSRQAGRKLFISSSDDAVPNKCAGILNTNAVKCHENNYTWKIDEQTCNHYEEWCKGRYAHEKTVDMATIKTWNRSSLLNFVAGLIDTDGSVYISRDHVTFSLAMQALPVIEAFEYACLALWQIQLNRSTDSRSKYKNGPVYNAYTRNKHEVKYILTELSDYLAKDSRKWKSEYETIGGNRSFADRVKLSWGSNRRTVNTYDITVSGKNNVYVLANGLVTSNSGKTQLGARECAWVFEGNHPTFDTKAAWGDRPLTLLVLGRTTRQLQEEIWERKIKPHLDPQCFTEGKSAGVLQTVRHRTNGNVIIFISHNNVNEARQNAQSFVAHWVWLDEMPNSVSLFAELEMRAIANKGRFLTTFTPLIKNLEIKNKIENVDDRIGRKYQFGMLDNPLYAGREEEILAQFASLPDGERNARLYGEWFFGERSVYDFDPALHVADPVNYSPSWRHMEVVDPAASSDSGYTLWAECPVSKVWFLIKAKYIAGTAPSDLLKAFMQESQAVNVIKRRSDPHEVFFIKEAAKAKIHYEGVYAKNAGMKMELIKNVREMLNAGRIKISNWAGEDIIEEFVSCQWSETKADSIQFKSRFHILDAVQYFCFDIPKPEATPVMLTWEQELRINHKLRRENENKPDKTQLRFGKFKHRIDRKAR